MAQGAFVKGGYAMIDIGNIEGRRFSELWDDLNTMERICLLDFWLFEKRVKNGLGHRPPGAWALEEDEIEEKAAQQRAAEDLKKKSNTDAA